ncbi:MAG TPA: LysR family transcriptional regulator [Acidobacteriota bacterium]|nr:LysR family transcriptional regulator [Acidobacteriota bacterium]
MEWLNYHHLFYFWTVAKEGTITKACKKLRLAQPTVSAQLRTLEERLDEKTVRPSRPQARTHRNRPPRIPVCR